MAMSTNRDFRFTVEQIWLLQRLRGSGLSRDQIVAGLEDLDRLDGAGSTPSPFTGSQFQSQVPNVRPLSNGSDHAKSPTEASEAEKYTSSIPTSMPSASHPTSFNSHNAQSTLHKNLSQAAAALLQNQKVPLQPFNMSVWANRVNPSVNPYAALNSFSNGINEEKNSENGFRKSEEPDDLAEELDQIQRAVEHCERRNQHEVKEEIRVFTQRHHISQTAISKATHQAISQSYISQWLTSNITMGDAKRRIIYEWFVRQKRRLEGVYPGHLNSVPVKTIVSSSSSLSSLPTSLTNRLMNHLPSASNSVINSINALSHHISERNSSPDMNLIQHRKPRQRIMWPLRCLQFLDSAFSRNPYPGAAERAQLVLECNSILGDDRTVDINEAHVANWFRNRRKMKKVIDQSTNKSMDQYDELIEMQEGSHDGDNQVTDILDVDDSRDERIKLEPKEAEGQFSQISSPDRLRIDEMRSGSSHEEINTSVNDIHRKSPSEITAEQQFNGSTRTTSPMSSLPNSMHSSLGIFHKEIMKSMGDSEGNRLSTSSIMQRIMSNNPPQLTPAPSHLLHSSLMQVNRNKIIQNMNINNGLEA